jgi:plastocyanin
MKKLRTALILFVLAAFALGGTALARTVSGTAQSAQAVADDGGGHHGDDSGQDDSGHHGDDADDDDGGATSGTTTSGATTSAATTGATTTSSRRRSASPAVVAGKQLIGTVGPGFSITLKTAAGAVVKTLPAGTYTVSVRDRSEEHNFHLTGRGVDKATSLGSVATSTWRVRLTAGTYTFKCDPHAQVMRGSIRVA